MAIKEVKSNYIVDVATELFLEKSIAEITIKDIAARADVGEATVYRYFCTKQNLVCAVAVKLEKGIFDMYFNIKQGENGYEKLCLFYGQYGKIFAERRELFKFINEFDAYMIGEGRTDSDAYSCGLELFKAVFCSAYMEGVADNSVRKLPDWEVFYYATTHAMLQLCKKLSMADIVIQDSKSKRNEEIAALADIILFSLKAL